MFSIDYTAKRKKNRNLVYNMMYSRPSLWTTYANQRQKYQMRIVQFSINYIWENFGETKLKKGIGGTQGTFAGLGVGYRSADSEYFCDVSCTGVQQFKKKSMEGLDYHGILGFMFKDNMEFKFDYCFDEQYYTLDLGYHY
ncbi:MAG TPA: hypothetical protein PLQ76_04450 [bacterium]|nr:hypothetical protein [bacterium]